MSLGKRVDTDPDKHRVRQLEQDLNPRTFLIGTKALTPGEEVTLRVDTEFTDADLVCFLPPVLHIKVENSDLKIAVELDLWKGDIISYLDNIRIKKKSLREPMKVHEGEEGSLYLRGMKFRLSPLPHDGSLQQPTATYRISPQREHPSFDARGINVPGNPTRNLGGVDDSAVRLHRYRRSTETLYIDILPVVDFSLYSRWISLHQDPVLTESEITRYLATVLTAVRA
ncbi:hypothetical protein EGW08_009536 [Elysia chlorotica]|uniref:Uncharacterized protein n=1 Tax=Elysia chlorotica TaxID=188477 RepID=A0A433TM86_ELYCH|nr:hypothetical protein EGW08_009536 [Elysia chlorotica]